MKVVMYGDCGRSQSIRWCCEQRGPTHNSRQMTLSGGLLDPPHGVPRHERKSCASPVQVLCLGMVATDSMLVETSRGGTRPGG